MKSQSYLLSLAVSVLVATVPELRAQVVADGATNTLSNITNAFLGDLTVGTNGSFTLLVLSDNVLLTNSVNGVIGLNTTARSNEVRLVSPSARWQAGGTLFIVGSNGSFNRLVVSNGATVRDNLAIVGENASASNNLAVVTGSGSVWSNGLGFYLGFTGAGNQLVVSNGGVLQNNNSGYLLSSSNLAVVTGSGSTWTNELDLQVGNTGAGNQLLVSNGGAVRNAHGYVGVNPTASNNLALITGAGSVWSNATDLEVGAFSANNQMTVSNGAAVFAAGHGFIGSATNANANSVTLTDPGTRWLVGNNLYVGSNGAFSRLVVSNGAFLTNGDGFIGHLFNGSNSTAIVSGTNSVWTNRVDLTVGNGSTGNLLMISNGGFVANGVGYMGRGGFGANTAVVSGAGSYWSSRSDLNVGYNAGGNRLVIENGGMVSSGNYSYIGYNVLVASNTVLVTGAGSLWSNRLDLTVGNLGAGNQLAVSNGGLVWNSVGYVGRSTAGNLALVTGTGSLWTNSSELYVGYDGPGNQMVVSNGATVSVAANALIGTHTAAASNSVTVTGSGTSLLVPSHFYVGSNSPFNRLVVSNGGMVQGLPFGFASIGSFDSSNSNNEAVVTGPGSLWKVNFLEVGHAGNGNRLVVSNGATMSSGAALIGGSSSSRTNEAVVTGAGSLWTNGDYLLVGASGTGHRLVITNNGEVFVRNNTIMGSILGQPPLISSNHLLIVDGGTLRTTNEFGTGTLDIQSGTNVLNAGLINVDQLVLTNTLGKFEFNGGTLITRGAVVSNGAPFVVGSSGTTPAIWDVRAGANDHILSGDFYVGNNSSFNQLFVTNGALLTNSFNLIIGVAGNSNVATISGPGSRCASGGSISLGAGAFNRLVVTNGGSLFGGGDAYVGSGLFAGANNQVLITGPGSVWNQFGQLYVGYFTGGDQLLVSDGGLVVCSNSYFGAFNNSSNNVTVVTGAGSVWNILDTVFVGDNGPRNQLQVTNGGLVTAANAVFIGVVNTSTNNSLLVDGGTLLVTNGAATGLLEIRRGTNVFNSGLISVDIFRMTNSPQSVFQFNGGTLSAKSSKISSGTLLSIGNGVSPATMLLAGNGTHDFSGNLVVQVSSNAVLTGNGTLAGGVSILSGGTLIPGSSVGKMIFTNAPSLHGTVLMEIRKNGVAVTNDQVQAITGTLTYGGSLIVSNIGPTALAAGDRFQLFNATNYAGSFTSLTLPPLDPTLTWKNKLLVDGSLEVSAPAALALSTLSSGSSGSYTQNFDALSISGTTNLWRDNSTLLGWYAAQSVSPFEINNYIASDGSLNFGGLYSFGSAASSDRALGSIPVNQSTEDIAYGLCFTNDTANSVSNFTITYTGEQWRNAGGTPRANTNTFWYRVSTVAITNPEPGIVTNWTSVPNLDFTSPTVLASATALNGNAATNRHIFSSVLVPGLVLAPGQNVFFRWHDINDTGADHGMAVDDLTVAFSQQFPPADRFWTNALGGNYEVAANWLSNIVAQPLDTAHFTSNTAYQVNWGADALAANAYFDAISGTVTQAIGSASWTLTSSFIVGRDAAATATVTHASGILRVTNSAGTALFKAGEAGGGTFNLNGGEVVTDTLLVTNGSKSVFNFPGGTLRSRNTTVNNGSRLTVGTNTTAGTFELLGGTHTFANGLTIQPNSLLTGTGDLSANISINLNGSVSPGPAQGGIGALNFNGALNFASTTTNLFDINKSAGTNDTLTCSSSISLNGTLIVTNLDGTLTGGDRFKLFTGSFASIGFTKLLLPPLTPGLSWKNDTHKDGSIEVVQTPARDFGEDVSHFQGASGVSQASWDQMFAEGKRFVFIKATEGLTGPHDAAMATNVERALAAGLLAGVYHFAHPENRPTTNGAIAEASNMVVYAGSAIGPGRLRPVLDIEGSAATLSTTALTDWVIAFSDEIIAQRGLGAAPIIYTLQSFANSELDSRLANYDLWIRAVSGGSDPQADDPPPQGFSTNALGVFNNWSFWQYSDTGSSGGISPLDLDLCHSEYKPLSSYLIPAPPPTPIQLGTLALTGNGAFQFSFTNTPGAIFTVLATTNAALPASNWDVLGAVTEGPPGQFQFTDLQTNNPQRFLPRSLAMSRISPTLKTIPTFISATLLATTVVRSQVVADGATNTLSNTTNTIPGDVIVGTNGSFTLLVISDNALLTNTANGVIGLNATAKSNEVRLISATARWFPSNQLFIGSNGSFNRLVVSNGATVRDINGQLGLNASASNNVAVVTGPGSVWSNANLLNLGFNGPGNQLIVSNGGVLRNNSAALGINTTSSNNIAVVSGSGSVWSNGGNLQFGGSGGNQLTVSNGGFVRSAAGSMGNASTGSNNFALVTGSGSIWSNVTELYVGNSGPGNRLVVSSGGTVMSSNSYVGANATASNNLALITGLGSLWSNALSLNVGAFSSHNQMVVSNGGLVMDSNGSIGFSASDSNNLALITGAGSVWSNGAALNVGETGSGNRLVVSNGGLVQCAFAEIGRNGLGGTNEAIVTGEGSTWTMPGIFLVGDAGSGNRVTVSNNAALRNSFGYMGFQGSNNTALVTGPGSVWTNAQDLYVGFAGPANQLVVADTGQVASSNGIVGFDPASSNNVALVTGSGSVWSTRSRLTVGESGSGNRLVVSNAGLVTNITGIIGQNNSSRGNEVTVTGPGSTWVSLTDLAVGNFGVGNRLMVSNGAQIQNAFGSLGLSGSNSTNNEALVTGPGSIWTNTSSLGVGGTGPRNRLIVTNGGTVFGGNIVTIGVLASATNNRVVVEGGALLVTNALGTGVLDVRRGTNLFNGGLIEVDQLRVTNKLGWIEFNGGTLITRGTSISNGSPFLIGISGSTPAVWDVRAGSTNHVITDYLEVGFNVPSCQLLVTNGASLSNAFGGIIGVNVGANSNAATISGIGSKWDAKLDFDLGFGGSFNRLLINAGGLLLTSNSFLGTATPSSNNLAIVSGANSVWSNRSTMFVGYLGGGNQLIVSNGGFIANALGEIGSEAESSNNVAVITGSGSLWTNSNDFYVGLSGPGNQLFVSNGGVLRDAKGVLGASISSSNNQAFVMDPGSLWSNRLELLVGDSGSGNRVAVSKGGTLFNSAQGTIGNGNGSRSNSVLVTDAGSSWLQNNGLYVGYAGSFNESVVSNGGFVSSSVVQLGFQLQSSNNLALVTDAGSMWSDSDALFVGVSGSGNRLQVSNGGVLDDGAGILADNTSSSNNQVLITGPASLWNNRDFLLVGSQGSRNQLVVSNGAAVRSANGSLGDESSSSNNFVVVTGSGSLWSNAADVYVGSSGVSNRLLVSNGALTKAGTGALGINNNANGNSVIVTDSGSSWLLTSNLLVGSNGAFNSLLISNSAVVANSNAFLGFGTPGGTNTIFVTGAGSVWSNRGDIHAGRSGSGNRFTISNGARVDCIQGQLGVFVNSSNNEALISGPGSCWNLEQSLTMGNAGSGNRLVITNGGRVRTGTGTAIGSAMSLNNEVVVTGAGSSWTNGTGLIVGGVGSASRVIVTNGAEVVIQGFALTVGSTSSSSNNRVVVDGGTLRVVNDALDVRRGTNFLNAGLIDVRSLLVTNFLGAFEFNGGTLRTTGTTNTNGRIFVIGNGSNSATLQLQGGTHLFTNNLTLSSNATLIGNGTIIGALTAGSGSVLAPGTSIGRLILSNSPTLQGTTVMEIQKSGSGLTNDQIQVAGPLTYGGSLIVTNIGTNALSVGDRYPLFNASSFAGNFSSITLPALSSGFIWTNKLAVDGSLEVTLPATTLTIQRSNNVLTLSWPTNALSYCLETAFDVTPPVLWQPVASGIVTNASSFVFSLTNTLGTPKQFFRLAFPCAPAPAPSLFIQLSSDLITVSWPSNAFRLEAALSLAPPVSWQTISNGLSNSGSLRNFTFTNHLAIPNQFFRLAFP